jgi:hypothetical protein
MIAPGAAVFQPQMATMPGAGLRGAPGHIGVRPARPRPGTVPLGPDVWRLQRPLREHPAAGGGGGGTYRIHWLGRPDRRGPVAPGVCEQRDGAGGNALHGTSPTCAGATGARWRALVRPASTDRRCG